jgi:hypothetical protein
LASGLTSRGTDSLDGLDRTIGLLVTGNDLAEDNVLAIEPVGYDSGDEELRSVAGTG